MERQVPLRKLEQLIPEALELGVVAACEANRRKQRLADDERPCELVLGRAACNAAAALRLAPAAARARLVASELYVTEPRFRT
jgi:hypothetical protein